MAARKSEEQFPRKSRLYMTTIRFGRFFTICNPGGITGICPTSSLSILMIFWRIWRGKCGVSPLIWILRSRQRSGRIWLTGSRSKR